MSSRNEDLCVEIALDILCGKGHVDPDDDSEWLADVEATLHRLYRAAPSYVRAPIRFKRRQTQLHLPGVAYDPALMWNMRQTLGAEHLAGTWEWEQQQRYERECAPRWACPWCHTEVGFYDTYWEKRLERVTFYSLDRDGQFVDVVKACPGCDRPIADMIRRGDGQMQLIEAA